VYQLKTFCLSTDNAGCTFCELSNILPVCKETISHLFWDCTKTNLPLLNAIQFYLNVNVTKRQFFIGEPFEVQNEIKTCLLSLFNVKKYVIWEFKWQKKIPTVNLFLSRVNSIWTGIVLCNKELKRCVQNSNLFNNMQR
jgi:hypothetical protein